MYTVKIMNEYKHGPIWVYNDKGIPCNYSLIDNDIDLKKLNDEGRNLYDSFYKFNTSVACEFSDEDEKDNRDKMLSIIKQIIKRLNEICDGTFIIEDYETQYLEKLK